MSPASDHRDGIVFACASNFPNMEKMTLYKKPDPWQEPYKQRQKYGTNKLIRM